MSQNVIKRTGRDRLRFAISFEVLLMVMLIPAGAMFFDQPFAEIGVLGVLLSGKAMVLHLIYNVVFDAIDARRGRISSQRSTLGRILHAVGFEATLMVTSLPIYMWLLGITLLEALMTDVVVTTFVVIYTYVYTLAYDRKFPLHEAPETVET